MVKIGFYQGYKEIHLLGCHFKVYRAHGWCISFSGQHRDLIKLRLLEYCYHSNRDIAMLLRCLKVHGDFSQKTFFIKVEFCKTLCCYQNHVAMSTEEFLFFNRRIYAYFSVTSCAEIAAHGASSC